MSNSDTQDAEQVVFIDANVPDLQDLLAGLAPGVQAFVLDPDRDGLQQIAAILAANDLTDLSSISIVGHGSSGAIEVGGTTLDDADLSSYAPELAEIGGALALGGDLALYARHGGRSGGPAIHRRPLAVCRRRWCCGCDPGYWPDCGRRELDA
jgi:hypothetical protein